MRRLFPFSALVVLIALAAPATAPAAVSGIVTVTGTAGKDEFVVRLASPGPELTVTPAATVTSPLGACPTENDLHTGRPNRNRCSAASVTGLVLNLQGGDDNVTVIDDTGNVGSATANAGPGNDVVAVSITGPRTLNGDVGDDHFRIPGPQTSGVTTFDGGPGRDLAAYGPMSTTGTVNPSSSVPVSIDGSLRTNQVILKRHEQGLTNLRTDTLTSIEGLEGTPLGDVITGGDRAATEVIGGEGPDNLTAGDVDTFLSGGPGLDNLQGGSGIDTLDGGTGIDGYKSTKGDTYLMRDGYAETVDCSGNNTVINDLADAVTSAADCTSIQTAAAKHKHDTTIAQRRLKISRRGGTAVKIFCPLQKAEACVGTLRLNKGGRNLASKRYRIARGSRKLLRFQLTKRQAARAAAGKVNLLAEETDDDGRPRAVLRRVPVRRKRA